MFFACSDWPLKLQIAFLPTSDQGRESGRGSFQLPPASVICRTVIFISTSESNYQIALNYLATATLTSQSLFRIPFTLTPLPQGQPPLPITGTDSHFTVIYLLVVLFQVAFIRTALRMSKTAVSCATRELTSHPRKHQEPTYWSALCVPQVK